MQRIKFALCLFGVIFIVSACSSDDGIEDIEPQRPADDLYTEASQKMDTGEYLEAARLYNEVERQHPYSEWATRAQLMAAYGYYKEMRYDEAQLALDRFIQLHPGNRDVDYAYYLRALTYYEQISDVGRDQAMTRRALEALNALVRRFPDSKYARDAQLKLDLTYDHLAGKEMEVGRYYLTRGHYQAAVKRFRNVVTDYQTTTHVPEALHRMVEAYIALGIRSEARRVAAVLGHNFPGSYWYQQSYALLDPEKLERLMNDRGWVDRTVESIFRPD